MKVLHASVVADVVPRTDGDFRRRSRRLGMDAAGGGSPGVLAGSLAWRRSAGRGDRVGGRKTSRMVMDLLAWLRACRFSRLKRREQKYLSYAGYARHSTVIQFIDNMLAALP